MNREKRFQSLGKFIRCLITWIGIFFFRSSIILVVLRIFSPLSYAQEIRVATDIWEGYSNRDGTGYYFDILREIYPSPEYVLKVSYVPFRRGLRMVETAREDVTLN